MKTPAFVISACFAISVPLAINSRVEAQEGGTLYPQGDPGLYRSVETEIKIEPNFRKETNNSKSTYPTQPDAPLIPPPPIPPAPVKEKPTPAIPQAKPVPKTYRSQAPRLEPAPHFSEPERRVELQNNPRIEIPGPPPNVSRPQDAYPPQNNYPPQNPEKRFPSLVFPTPPQSFPAPPQVFPTPPITIPAPFHTDFPEPPRFRNNGATLTKLREAAHSLSRQGIKYKHGHYTPLFGGLDSSGSVQFLLSELGVPGVPRTIGGQLAWSKDHNMVHQFENRPAVPDLANHLEPGNLVFWGEFQTGRLTHVMIYLGYDNNLGQHFAFGTRGGTEVGLHSNEVDVFELKLERERIVATGKIPGLNYR